MNSVIPIDHAHVGTDTWWHTVWLQAVFAPTGELFYSIAIYECGIGVSLRGCGDELTDALEAYWEEIEHCEWQHRYNTLAEFLTAYQFERPVYTPEWVR